MKTIIDIALFMRFVITVLTVITVFIALNIYIKVFRIKEDVLL